MGPYIGSVDAVWAVLRSLRVLAVRPEVGGRHDINIAGRGSQGLGAQLSHIYIRYPKVEHHYIDIMLSQ